MSPSLPYYMLVITHHNPFPASALKPQLQVKENKTSLSTENLWQYKEKKTHTQKVI